MVAVLFAIGGIAVTIALVVIACAMAGSNADDGYEQWRNSEYRNEREKEHEKRD